MLVRREIVKGKIRALLVKDDDVSKQLGQVLGDLNLKADFDKSRYEHDNYLLEKISKPLVEDKVVAYVFKTQEEFLALKKRSHLLESKKLVKNHQPIEETWSFKLKN